MASGALDFFRYEDLPLAGGGSVRYVDFDYRESDHVLYITTEGGGRVTAWHIMLRDHRNARLWEESDLHHKIEYALEGENIGRPSWREAAITRRADGLEDPFGSNED